AFAAVSDAGSDPRRIVEAGAVPPLLLEPGVVALAMQKIGEDVRPQREQPLLIGDDAQALALLELDVQHRAELRFIAVVLRRPLSQKPDIARIPAFSEQHAHHILATLQEWRHIVGLMLHTSVVIGPSRA